MKKIILALKYVFLNVLYGLNNFMIFISHKKINFFRNNKVKIACAIITILLLVYVKSNIQTDYHADPNGPTCYASGPPRPSQFVDGFFNTLKKIFFIEI